MITEFKSYVPCTCDENRISQNLNFELVGGQNKDTYEGTCPNCGRVWTISSEVDEEIT